MNGEGEGGANAGSLGPLLVIEGTPLWPSIREFGSDNIPAAHANDFGAFIVPHEASASAFRTLPNL